MKLDMIQCRFTETSMMLGIIEVSVNLHLILSSFQPPHNLLLNSIIQMLLVIFFWISLNVTKKYQDIQQGMGTNKTQKLPLLLIKSLFFPLHHIYVYTYIFNTRKLHLCFETLAFYLLFNTFHEIQQNMQILLVLKMSILFKSNCHFLILSEDSI